MAALFAATGTARNPLLVQLVKSITLWYILQASNAGVDYEIAESRYDRAVKLLRDIAKGEATLDSAPELVLPEAATEQEEEAQSRLRFGGREKFNHE